MTQGRIMIVEDERITAEDIHDILTHLGYTVTALVSSGADAIREAERTSPDLVLMDIRIKGDMDGIEAAREIRERFDIPAVYLTAHAWTQVDIGLVLTVSGLVALAGQMPAGALVDWVRSKKQAAAWSVVAIAVSALALAVSPLFAIVLLAEIVHALASCVLSR